MHARVKNVLPLPDYRLVIEFKDGGMYEYDVKPLIERFPAFKPLCHEKGLFERVAIDCGGCAVAWNDSIDIDAEELRANGRPMVFYPMNTMDALLAGVQG